LLTLPDGTCLEGWFEKDHYIDPETGLPAEKFAEVAIPGDR
jgi:hypothetical protein